jgi:hypothetical protein
MPSRRDMSRSAKTKRPRTRLSPSDKSALLRADALIGPDAADNRNLTASTLERDEPDTGTEPDPTHESQESKTVLYFDDGTEWFNYESLPSNVADEARKVAAEIRKAEDNYYYRVGDYLTAIHQKLEYGYWTAWLKLEAGISPQNAQNYMAYYRFSQIHGADVAKLFMQSVVYRLASAPESVTLLLMKRAKAGERITVSDVRQAISDAYQPPQPTLNDSRDEEGEEAPDRSAGDTEGDGAHADTDGQLDETTSPSDDRLRDPAVDFADQLVAVLSGHPLCGWFQKQAHALITYPLRCREVVERVDKGLAVIQRRNPDGTDI